MSMSTTIHVATASPYDVVVGDLVLDALPGMLGQGVRRIAIVRPENLDIGFDLGSALDLVVPAGEAAKTAAVVADCWERLGQAGFTRSDAIITLGGGATTDVGGFVAATWLRGVRVVHIPTTLLGMVDAAVGGKTGINTGSGKNLVGSFHEPAGVICDLGLLSTLPRAELVSGLGEVIKCGFVADPEILRLVESDPDAALDPTTPVLRELVERAIRVKAEVVAGDLKETGGAGGHPGREVLNYGHTMAHAIEKGTDYRIRHGEAVALGMVYVAELARLAGRLDEETALRHAAVLSSVGLATGFDKLPFEDLLATMRVDKKSRGDQLRFVVLDGLARMCEEWGAEQGLEVEVRQTNHEGEMLDWLNLAADEDTPVVLNAGAWTHYSYALLDACAQLTAPLVELHLSDPKARPEEFRHHSVITAYAAKEIVGQGIDGYREAIEFVASTARP